METLLPGHILDSVLEKDNGVKEITGLEMRLREDASLVGCGFDLQIRSKENITRAQTI